MAPISLSNILNPANPLGLYGIYHPSSFHNKSLRSRRSNKDALPGSYQHTQQDHCFQPIGRPIDTRIWGRAADATKPEPNAMLSASSLEERERARTGGSFTVDDLLKRYDTEFNDSMPGLFDRDAGVKDVSAREDEGFLLGDPDDSSTWVINDMVARMSPEYHKKPLIYRRRPIQEVRNIIPRGLDGDLGGFVSSPAAA